ncbi:MAG: hypothetical protein ABH879_02745 [archaeon]
MKGYIIGGLVAALPVAGFAETQKPVEVGQRFNVEVQYDGGQWRYSVGDVFDYRGLNFRCRGSIDDPTNAELVEVSYTDAHGQAVHVGADSGELDRWRPVLESIHSSATYQFLIDEITKGNLGWTDIAAKFAEKDDLSDYVANGLESHFSMMLNTYGDYAHSQIREIVEASYERGAQARDDWFSETVGIVGMAQRHGVSMESSLQILERAYSNIPKNTDRVRFSDDSLEAKVKPDSYSVSVDTAGMPGVGNVKTPQRLPKPRQVVRESYGPDQRSYRINGPYAGVEDVLIALAHGDTVHYVSFTDDQGRQIALNQESDEFSLWQGLAQQIFADDMYDAALTGLRGGNLSDADSLVALAERHSLDYDVESDIAGALPDGVRTGLRARMVDNCDRLAWYFAQVQTIMGQVYNGAEPASGDTSVANTIADVQKAKELGMTYDGMQQAYLDAAKGMDLFIKYPNASASRGMQRLRQQVRAELDSAQTQSIRDWKRSQEQSSKIPPPPVHRR